MSGERFEVRVESGFRASHRRDAKGEIASLHAHDWRVAVRVCSTTLDTIAIVVDFRRLRADLDRALAELQGTELERHAQLGRGPTTALALGCWLLDRMRAGAAEERWRVCAVEVECDPGVRYVVTAAGGD